MAGTPSDEQLLAAVAEGEAEMEALLADLVRARPLFGAEADGQDVMRRAFAGLGLDPVDVPLDADALRASPAASPFSWDVAGKASVIARWPPGGEGGRSLILNGHVDVVSAAPEALWSFDPWAATRDGEWMYGRGAGDMKAGLAAIVGAVAGLRRLGLAPCAPVELQSVVEEECTGNGAAACLLAGSRADAAVLTEPTAGAIWNAQVGVLWFSVRVAGTPGPRRRTRRAATTRSRRPTRSSARCARSRQSSTPLRRRPSTRSSTRSTSTSARSAAATGRRPSRASASPSAASRCYPGERVADLRARVEETVAAAARDDAFLARCEVEVRYDGFACEGYELAGGPLIDAVAAAAERVSGTRPGLVASTATTDARTFHLYGDTPAICFGPRAERIHSIDERVHLPSMLSTAQAVALFVRDWCGVTSAQ